MASDWSAWTEFDLAIRLAPDEPRVYKIRCRSDAQDNRIRYVGETGAGLSGRLRGLRQGMNRVLGGRQGRRGPPHIAAYCIAQLVRQGEELEVSWRSLVGIAVSERKVIEADIISAYWRLTGRIPDCQYGQTGTEGLVAEEPI